jgi:hypothetical protein
MPTKRRPLSRSRKPSISAEALACWRQIRALERRGATKTAEYSDLGKRLAILCGLDWCSMQWPSTAKSPTLPANLRGRELQAQSYREAYAARCALLAAEAAADREAAAGRVYRN